MARSSIGSGRGPLKAERRVRFPYALPLKINCLHQSAGGVQEERGAPTEFSGEELLRVQRLIQVALQADRLKLHSTELLTDQGASHFL